MSLYFWHMGCSLRSESEIVNYDLFLSQKEEQMSKVYESLKEVVHETLQRSKNNPIPLGRVNHNHASRLSREIGELEKVVVQKMAGLKRRKLGTPNSSFRVSRKR
jgi:hypothetical protein